MSRTITIVACWGGSYDHTHARAVGGTPSPRTATGSAAHSTTTLPACSSTAEKLRDPYNAFNPQTKEDCKAIFQDLTDALQDPEGRDAWVKQHRGLDILCSKELMMPDHQKMPGGPALGDDGGDGQYRTVFGLWLISYDPVHSLTFGGKGDSVPANCINGEALKRLIQVLRHSKKTRVVRVALMCLRNMLNKGFNADIVDFGAVDVLNTLSAKKWPDEEIPEDIAAMLTILRADVKDLSTWSQYRQEVISGELSFKNPAHNDESFWRTNIMRFEEKDFEVMKQLAQTLKECSMDTNADNRDTKIAVACHDLGEIARIHPRGGKVIGLVPEAKTFVFQHMESSDTEVKREALLCVQKMMVAAVAN